ncbi:TPA: WYL domain-containing protein [Aeromonas veronii]
MPSMNHFRILVDELSLPQAERLAFIDFKIMYLGEITRQDIINEFRIGQAAASNDLRLYRERRPENSRLDHTTKKTVIVQESYKPLVNIDAHTALDFIQNGFCRSRLHASQPSLPVEIIDPRLAPNTLDDDQVATVTRAMKGQYGIKCEYESRSSNNHHERILFPVALFADRQNWYVRAYDRTSSPAGFKNFKLSRIKTTKQILDEEQRSARPEEKLENDIRWHTRVPLELVVADDKIGQQLSREFCLDNGRKTIICRSALIYFTRVNWRIDVENGDDNIFYFKLANIESLKLMDIGDDLTKNIRFGN